MRWGISLVWWEIPITVLAELLDNLTFYDDISLNILDDSENGSAIGFNDVKLNIQSKIAKGESHLIAQYIEDLLKQQSENFTDRQIKRLKQFKICVEAKQTHKKETLISEER